MSSLLGHTIVYQPNTTAVNSVDHLLKPTFSVQNKVLEGRLSEMGNNVNSYTSTHGDRYSISVSNDNSYMNAWSNGKKKKRTYSTPANKFRATIKSLNDINTNIGVWALGTAVVMAIVVVAQFIPVANVIVDSVISIVSLATGGGIGVSEAYELANLIVALVVRQEELDTYYGQI